MEKKFYLKRNSRLRAMLGLALGLVALPLIEGCSPAPQNACNYTLSREGTRVSWKGHLPIVMYLEKDFPGEYEVAIVNAMRTWNRNAQKNLFQLSDTRVSSDEAKKKGLNIIVYHQDGGGIPSNRHGETHVSFVGDQLVNANIHFNGGAQSGFSFYVSRGPANKQYNIEATALHELGHVLGLKHPDDSSSNTVMSPYLAQNSDRVELTKQDIQFLKCEY